MITVKEYIERSVVISELECLPDQGELDYLGVFDCVRNTPAAEVKPIETAYWDWQLDGTHFCSECGNDAPLRYVDEYCSFYCPHCGRRMTHVEDPIKVEVEEVPCDAVKIRTIVMEGPDEFKTAYYTPTCKCGYTDCIYDNAYIKATYPEWYEELQQSKGIDTCDVCINGDRYDDEDR